MTVVEDEFESPPSPTIYYTYNDTLEGLGCCELHESVSAHTIWVPKVRMGQAKLVPSQSWKIGVVTVSAPIYQSQPACLTFHHTNEERLEGLMRCCEMTESVCTRTILVSNVGAMHQNFHHRRLKS